MSWRYALKVLTAPNWFARMRILLAMLWPEALAREGGPQFSIWDSAQKCFVGDNELTVVPEDAYGVI